MNIRKMVTGLAALLVVHSILSLNSRVAEARATSRAPTHAPASTRAGGYSEALPYQTPKEMGATDTALGFYLIPNSHSANVSVDYARSGSTMSFSASTSGKSLGFGVGPQYSLGQDLAIEADLAYLPRKMTTNTTTVTMNALQLSPLIRYSPIAHLSFGLGPYVAQGIGDIESVKNGKATSKSYQASGLKKTDYGVALAAGSYLNLADRAQLVLDLRYQLGIANLATTQSSGTGSLFGPASISYKMTSWQMLFGVRFGL